MKAVSVNCFWMRGLCAAGALFLLLAMPRVAGAQGNPEPLSFKFDRGQGVQPIFAGWARKPDGGYSMYFGYINRNYLETPVVPIGPDNKFEPGAPDRGQPTVFNTRISYWGVSRGRTGRLGEERAGLDGHHSRQNGAELWAGSNRSGNPIPSIKVRLGMLESLKNTPPVLTVASEATASVAAPLSLTATVTDDGLPVPRKGPRKAAVGPGNTPNAETRSEPAGDRAECSASGKETRCPWRARKGCNSAGPCGGAQTMPSSIRRPSR